MVLIDANGSVARNKDVYLQSNGGKWVRYDAAGHMVKGEDYRYGAWYYFDTTTGAMAKGITHVPSNGGKWVYYDLTTGKMLYGERYELRPEPRRLVSFRREHRRDVLWLLFQLATT